ncbi:MAG TPA: hypothetical protein VN903_35965 [Polyangia bacterium]|jgi:hypothetical protein|nr:hypothetical protein [Polyangia bacterium]
MKDPTDFGQRWLTAARAEEPPPEVVARIERALGLGAVIAPETTARAAAKPGLSKPGLSALKIAGLSALGVGGAVGLVLLLSRPAPPPAVEPPSVSPPPAVESAPAANTASAPSAPRAPAVEHATSASTGALRDEIALIDAARAALAAGSPAQALSLLERYRARHPQGMLLPEALAMRIEAIDRSGEHARARALARAFLADYPNSPLAQRVAHIGAR